MQLHPSQTLLYASRNTLMYRTWDATHQIPVVVKVLTGQQRTSSLTLLQREFEMTRKLEAAGFRRVLEYAEHQGQPALFLEYLPGQTLFEHLQTHALTLPERLELAKQLTGQLSLVQQHGIVHKDVGYHNVLVSDSGKVHLIDFGLSSPLSHRRTRNTELVAMEGSFPFMSPEQTGRVNRAVDHRSDLYSLGVVLYWLFTGRLPFEAADPVGWVHCHIALPPVAPRQWEPGLPPLLGDLILKLLSKSPEERYQSAYGVLMDLQRVLEDAAEETPAGAFDRLEHHQFPQKLYGRDAELLQLEQALQRVQAGACEGILVHGYAGVGKTELLQQLQQPVAAQQGHFIRGTFSALQQHEPCQGLIQAVQQAIRQLLSEGTEALRIWKLRLQQALGNQGGVIAAVVPELLWLLGPQPEVPPLPFQEHENRFVGVFVRFLQTLAREDHPLVLFLDDLQWADGVSLRVLSGLLVSADSHNLLLLGAYRNRDLTEDHPLLTTSQAAVQAGGKLTDLPLEPLEPSHIRDFLSDTLHMAAEQLSPLAELVHQKAGGNPHFTLEFVENLIEQQLLSFNHQTGSWQWNVQALQQVHATDNTLEVLAQKVCQLPENTLQVLGWAACLGSAVKVELLSRLLEEPQVRTVSALLPAVDAGFLTLGTEQVQFQHERIQQGVYQQLPEAERTGRHLRLGRGLLKLLPDDPELLFQTVRHLSLGLGEMSDPAERERVAEMCLQAARKARSATAYSSAVAFLDAGLSALPERGWLDQYSLWYLLHLEALQARFLTRDPEGAEQHFQQLVQHAANPTDLARAYTHKLDLLAHHNRYPECLQLGREALQLFGIQVPETGIMEAIQQELQQVLGRVLALGVPELLHLPEMEAQPEREVLMRLLSSLVTVGYFSHPPLMMYLLVQQLRFCLDHGNSQQAVVAYYGMALMLMGSGKIDLAWAFMQVALQLAERYQHPFYLSRARQVFGTTVNHWKNPPLSSLPHLEEAKRLAQESGDPTYVVFSVLPMFYAHFNAGHHLEHLERCIEENLEVVRQKPHALLMTRMQLMLVELLRGDHTSQLESCSRIYQQALEEDILALKNLPVEHRYHSMQSLLLYLSGDVEAALLHTQRCQQYRQKNTSMSLQMNVEDTFCQALILLALHPQRTAEQQEQDLQQVKANLLALEQWAKHAPMNYLHQQQLVQAELAWVQGDPHLARDAFEAALQSLSGSINHKDTALTLERFSLFQRERGNSTLADLYLKEAHTAYRKWGARVKVLQLERQHPHLFVQDAPGSHSSGMASITTFSEQQASRLDVLAFTQASLVISGEIVLENLLNRMMVTVMQCAGAQQVTLLLKDGENWFTEATHSAQQSTPRVMLHQPLRDLPLSVVQYVIQTRESVVEGNARHSQRFPAETHFRDNDTRSVLCLPILHQGEVKGVLYLENNLASHVFTERQVQVLQLLSSQMAISIEHARIYSHLEELVQERTAALESAYVDLQKSQEEVRHLAYHDSLTGLPNRKLLTDRMEQALARCRRHGGSLAMVYLDLDGFKEVNDTLGHDAGDQLLCEVADRLRQVVRTTDTVSRMGGDEFVVLLESLESLQELEAVARRIFGSFRDPIVLKGQALELRSSVGLSMLHSLEDSPEDLLQRADHNMYLAKRSGKNRWCLDGVVHELLP
ncbi:diguanylate cyclase domain-containing protein [Deinococcus roseus]|uniref:Serine/threonine protein kinase n=1 Tax=Deinococcus roseus TaxID=392414 RepID=A0ABQ2D244_9DEIO|nr:diguanylate cyclase [Deinococcus roseus]GGJ42792.1 serine/threonine protein kinase [Deinococcus roseus]